MRYPKHQQGFSIVEILVAVVVGLILMTGVIQIAENSTDSFRIQNAVMRMQENGQFAMSYLAKDIRNVDFWGCLGTSTDPTVLITGGGGYNTPMTPLVGTANASGSGAQLAGTDAITVQGVTTVGSGQHVVAPFGPTSSAALTVNSAAGISTGTALLVSDCLGGDLFQVTGVAGTAISHDASANTSANLSKVYDGTASIYFPYTHTYDIRNGAWGGGSLFVTSAAGLQELAQGVQSMVILYGEDTDSDGVANVYRRANVVSNMDNVINIRVMLLLETLEDNLTPQPIAYTFNGVTVTPADRRLREVFTQTMVLRNRSK